MSDGRVLEILDGTGAADVALAGGLNFVGEFSFLAWMRPEPIGTYPIFAKSTTQAAGSLAFGLHGDRLELRTVESERDGGGVRVTGGHVSAQKWQHVAVTRDGAGIVRLYHQGVLVGQGKVPGVAPLLPALPPQSSDRLMLGGTYAPNGDAFRGGLADVRIYGYALSLAEIRALASPITPVY